MLFFIITLNQSVLGLCLLRIPSRYALLLFKPSVPWRHEWASPLNPTTSSFPWMWATTSPGAMLAANISEHIASQYYQRWSGPPTWSGALTFRHCMTGVPGMRGPTGHVLWGELSKLITDNHKWLCLFFYYNCLCNTKGVLWVWPTAWSGWFLPS